MTICAPLWSFACHSVNFNGLNTRDPEGAKSFYGAVFGWGTLELPGGFTMWTLEGYGDHLAEGDPGLRERMRDTGTPAGFEDVVASLIPIQKDQPDTPPHWGVTFAVDDADAIAARAAELGGQVIVPPLDAPGPDDRDPRSPGGHVHGEQVRAREREPGVVMAPPVSPSRGRGRSGPGRRRPGRWLAVRR